MIIVQKGKEQKLQKEVETVQQVNKFTYLPRSCSKLLNKKSTLEDEKVCCKICLYKK